ncbi:MULTISPECIES: hypothetical protein [unclassified Brenneria]|uniref:hypothetical protein n=1 Tax=unclassified Brenneria TaxID=2634434 RepID=UPI0029C115F7|nr:MULTISPECIES: hypothetical protein [unclassified Brenneria]MDX5627498.1 hypothetical protein [Brenneria sp. L3-3Z]MDX5694346.1 hypothetical protein [Brenneria sp. L4-2C]MEE3662070.1 hypothetical protein [Brenneria sp. g21c3]
MTNWLANISDALRCRIDQLITPPLIVSAADESGISEVILSMGYIYGIETGNVYLVSNRTE